VTVTGDYVAGVSPGPSGFGLLRVVTDPWVASTIYVNNVPMDDGSLNWVKLPPGTYTVHFTDGVGYASPLNQTVTVTVGEATTVTGTFTPLGSLHVITDPWLGSATIYVDGTPMDDGGVWVALVPGTYTVSFGDVPGKTTPLPQTVTVTAGESTTATGYFT